MENISRLSIFCISNAEKQQLYHIWLLEMCNMIDPHKLKVNFRKNSDVSLLNSALSIRVEILTQIKKAVLQKCVELNT